jgi:predicted dehydrogenase
MEKPLQVGVIGLGRRWRRQYRPALRALRPRYRVRAVCDPVHRRAVRAAADLGCEAAAGPMALLEDDRIEALLLVDEPWYGLWPLELACRAKRPVFCAWPLEADDAHADAVRRQVEESRLPVLMALPLRLAPATARLRVLLDERLGPARLVVCNLALSGRRRAGLVGDVGTALLDWCVSFFGAAPESVLAGAAAGFASVLLEFPDGRAAVIQSRRTRRRPGLRLLVEAERGSAEVRPPASVGWADAEGRCTITLPVAPPAARLLLEQFHAMVRGGRGPQPSFADAHGLLGWLRAAALSRAEGRRVHLGEPRP